MHDDSVLVAIEAALRSNSRCACGRELDLEARGGRLWLECPVFARPSRLPPAIATAIRDITHIRRFVAEERDPSAAGATGGPSRVSLGSA